MKDWVSELTNWRWAAFLNRSRMVQACLIVPFVGYLIVFSDFAMTQLQSTILLGTPLLLSIPVKLFCVYWGGILISINLVLYYWKCPLTVKRFVDDIEYVQYATGLRSRSFIEAIYWYVWSKSGTYSPRGVAVKLCNPVLLRAYAQLFRSLASIQSSAEKGPLRELADQIDGLMQRHFSGNDVSEEASKLAHVASETLSKHSYAATTNENVRADLVNVLCIRFRDSHQEAPLAALCSNVFGYVGTFVFLIPSLETFLKVVLVTLRKMISY
jgi:hypothetical protein